MFPKAERKVWRREKEEGKVVKGGGNCENVLKDAVLGGKEVRREGRREEEERATMGVN